MIEVIWREWFNAEAVKKLTEMKTLSRNVWTTCFANDGDGERIAQLIAKDEWESDPNTMPATIVILEPDYLAGTYDLEVEYDPQFSATKRREDQEQ